MSWGKDDDVSELWQQLMEAEARYLEVRQQIYAGDPLAQFRSALEDARSGGAHDDRVV